MQSSDEERGSIISLIQLESESTERDRERSKEEQINSSLASLYYLLHKHFLDSHNTYHALLNAL